MTHAHHAAEAKSQRARHWLDLELVVHRESAGAFFASISGQRSEIVVLPKSQCDLVWKRRPAKHEGGFLPDVSDDPKILGLATMTMPRALASEKGLI